MLKSPCNRDCPDRLIGCHAKCEKYAEYAAKTEKARKQRRLHKADEYTLDYTMAHARRK